MYWCQKNKAERASQNHQCQEHLPCFWLWWPSCKLTCQKNLLLDSTNENLDFCSDIHDFDLYSICVEAFASNITCSCIVSSGTLPSSYQGPPPLFKTIESGLECTFGSFLSTCECNPLTCICPDYINDPKFDPILLWVVPLFTHAFLLGTGT